MVVGLSLPALAVSPVELHKFTASDANAGDEFGRSVAISGTTALVGAYLGDGGVIDSGSAYLYDFSDAYNITEIKLTIPGANIGDRFGNSVAISGTTAIVGAYLDDGGFIDSGSAYLFDAAFSDWFGYSVALNGNTAIVGAYQDDDAGSDSGSAYLFCISPVGDINLDCRVDFVDFALMAGNWLVDCLLEPSDPACLAQ